MSANDHIVDIDIRLNRGNFQLGAKFATEGGLTALFGKSGAGKSTIIDCVAGLVCPDSGHIRIAGETLFDSARGINLAPEKRRVGYVFQDARLFPHMQVGANLAYGMKLISMSERRHTISDVVGLLGIGKLLDRYPADLSGGEVQRVAIGRALLASPKILLMDEPLAALDFDRKAEIMPFIERLRDEAGVPIIYVSHAVEEVVRLADTMVVLADGDTVAFGDVEDIMSRLDLRPHTGRFEAGAVIHVWVAGHDDDYMLTELGFGAGSVWVPRLELDRGTPLRLRLRARDVSLSMEQPRGSMTLNTFEGTIVDIENVAEGISPHVDVLVNCGAPVIARVTRRSMDDHDLKPGMKVYASVKTSSIDRHSLGLGRRR